MLAGKANGAIAMQNSDKFQNVVKLLIESDIDLKQMIEGTQEIISLYEMWEQFNEKAIREAVNRCLKENGLNV